jgi:predicted AAA+ superfamily ATPase
MAGPVFETWVLGEILKSYWHRAREPAIYGWRDRDGHEVDLLLSADGRLLPVEVKLGASPSPRWIEGIRALRRSGEAVGPAAVVCLAERRGPIERDTEIVPAGLL